MTAGRIVVGCHRARAVAILRDLLILAVLHLSTADLRAIGHALAVSLDRALAKARITA